MDFEEISDPNNDYYLFVTAVIGQNESVPEEAPSFSYFKDSLADQICEYCCRSYLTFQFDKPELMSSHTNASPENSQGQKNMLEIHDNNTGYIWSQ